MWDLNGDPTNVIPPEPRPLLTMVDRPTQLRGELAAALL